MPSNVQRLSIFGGLNLFGRFSSDAGVYSTRRDVENCLSESIDQSAVSTKESHCNNEPANEKSSAEDIPSPSVLDEITDSASPANLPKSGCVSISTAFTAIFVVSVAILGASLMIVSAKYSAESIELSAHGTDKVQEIFLSLVESTNSRLINASNYSINTLAEIIVQQVNERVVAAVSSYTGKCKFSVTQMAGMTANGEIDVLDMDAAFRPLWRQILELPDVASLILAGAEHGNWIVIMQGLLQEARFTLLVRNTSGTACRACLPAATNDSYRYTVDPADPMNWTYTGAHFKSEPRSRPWYLAGLSGQGAGRWTAPYVFNDEGSIGITAARLARAGGAGRSSASSGPT
jgi:hypothetical protein